jgi:hypothetical protein
VADRDHFQFRFSDHLKNEMKINAPGVRCFPAWNSRASALEWQLSEASRRCLFRALERWLF